MEYAMEYFTPDATSADMGRVLLMLMHVLYHNLMAVSIARWQSGRERRSWSYELESRLLSTKPQIYTHLHKSRNGPKICADL